MTTASCSLAALLSSRICHDLISPIGAISNGVELLQMSGAPDTPEMDLIRESVENANARIRFFRIAYGVAAPDQMVSAAEIREILADLNAGGRLAIDWQSDLDQPRQDVKLLFLLIQCMETAMPWGGRVTLQRNALQWEVSGTSDRMKSVPELWGVLNDIDKGDDVSASEVHFLLLSSLLVEYGRAIQVDVGDTGISASY